MTIFLLSLSIVARSLSQVKNEPSMDPSKFDSSKISVISAKKVNPDKLIQFGDRVQESEKAKEASASKCSVCCALAGMMISGICIPILTVAQTRMAIIYHSNIKYTTQGILRHAGWLSMPGIVIAGSMHFLLSETMWSQKRHSFGQAWARAAAINSLIWCSGIGISTLVWRKVLPNVMRLRPYYFRYPIPSVPVDVRLIGDPSQFWTGMGATYFLLGLFYGQMGFLTCVGFCTSYSRLHFIMSPHGMYARACLPMSKREYIERAATVTSPVSPSQ